jgi:hypothetical protein
VEYLPVEKKWQAYVLDKAISEVSGINLVTVL